MTKITLNIFLTVCLSLLFLSGCSGSGSETVEVSCGNGSLDAGEVCDGEANCSVDCLSWNTTTPVVTTETSCTDGVDNDGDTAVDCDDADCELDAACPASASTAASPATVAAVGGNETLCDDDADNDGDGLTDCDDADCDASCASASGGDEDTEATPIDTSRPATNFIGKTDPSLAGAVLSPATIKEADQDDESETATTPSPAEPETYASTLFFRGFDLYFADGNSEEIQSIEYSASDINDEPTEERLIPYLTFNTKQQVSSQQGDNYSSNFLYSAVRSNTKYMNFQTVTKNYNREALDFYLVSDSFKLNMEMRDYDHYAAILQGYKIRLTDDDWIEFGWMTVQVSLCSKDSSWGPRTCVLDGIDIDPDKVDVTISLGLTGSRGLLVPTDGPPLEISVNYVIVGFNDPVAYNIYKIDPFETKNEDNDKGSDSSTGKEIDERKQSKDLAYHYNTTVAGLTGFEIKTDNPNWYPYNIERLFLAIDDADPSTLKADAHLGAGDGLHDAVVSADIISFSVPDELGANSDNNGDVQELQNGGIGTVKCYAKGSGLNCVKTNE